MALFEDLIHRVRYWLLRNLPPCQAMAPLMSASLERPLTLRERVVLRLHLWVCIWCVWYLEQLHFIREATREGSARVSSDEAPSPVVLSEEARERIKVALARQGE